MFWGGFGCKGKTDLVEIQGALDSEGYIRIIQDQIVGEGVKLAGRGFILQQDNARPHTSKITKEYMASKNLRVMDWISCSPDMNPMENLWGILTRNVYANGRQYATLTQLKEAVREAWDNLSISTLTTLIASMKNRIFELIRVGGKSTKY